MPNYLACDLGAESGRVMLGSIEGEHLKLEEIHRFPNQPIRDGDSMYWNVPALLAGINDGLRKAGARGLEIRSISCDSWGLDCVLLDGDDELIEPVYHYRDPRTAEGVKRVFAKLPWEEVFAETGIQFMPINALYHLAMETPARLERVRRIVPIGDAFNFFLCGVAKAEVSMASTTQLYNPTTRSWSEKVVSAVNLAPDVFPEIAGSGTPLGPLRKEVAEDTGLTGVSVVACCTHDTGSAVAAVPATGGVSDEADWAYLSSGTWSLMGVERKTPLINDACREMNLTNEIGYNGSIRLLKNIIGLWLVQECRRTWSEAGRELGYGELASMAADAAPFKSLINPDDERFMAPGDMPSRIADFCRETKQPVPESSGEFLRCCLESLALLYRDTLRRIEELTGSAIKRLHIVGGGSQNQLLNQFTANACGIPVMAGPVEATALGNIIVQAIVAGDIDSLKNGRAIIGASYDLEEFQPESADEWLDVVKRFEGLRGA